MFDENGQENWFDREHILKSLITPIIGFAAAGIFYGFTLNRPFGKNIVRMDTDRRVVALTFDDGPNPPYTDRLLDVLAKHNVKATFFMIGNRIGEVSCDGTPRYR